MGAAFRTVLGLALAALVLAGSYQLDVGQSVRDGYLLLLLGAALLVLIPDPVWNRMDRVGWGSPLLHWPVMLLLFLAGLGLSATVAASVGERPWLSASRQISFWLAAGTFIVFAFHVWDKLRHPEPFAKQFEKADWYWVVGLALAASAARIWNIATEPPGLSYDEIVPMGRTLRIAKGLETAPGFWTGFQGFNGIFHHLVSFFLHHLGWLGLDTVQTAKLPNALFGGVSVACLYVMARLLGTAPVAATAAAFLLWQGWHWNMSRFYYRYSGDLLWISLTTALLLAGLKSRRASLVAASGFTGAIGVGWLNSALVVAPWSLVVLAEHFVTEPADVWRRLVPGGVWLFTFAVCVLPIATQFARQPTGLWVMDGIAERRLEVLEQKGMTSAEAYVQAVLRAVSILQIREEPRAREAIRPDRPALDMVLSGMATIGFVWCLRFFFCQRAARICLLGILFFAVPAISSYPAHADALQSRRMIGTSFFLAWMAALGTSVIARRVAPAQKQFRVMLLAAAASIVLNLAFIRSEYNPSHWYDEYGVNRVYFVRALREAAEVGPVFFRPTYFSGGASRGVVDYSNVTLVESPAEVRDGLMRSRGVLCTVILPWPTEVERNDSPAWIEELADVIPPFYWEWGPPNAVGAPIYRIARIRIDQR